MEFMAVNKIKKNRMGTLLLLLAKLPCLHMVQAAIGSSMNDHRMRWPASIHGRQSSTYASHVPQHGLESVGQPDLAVDL